MTLQYCQIHLLIVCECVLLMPFVFFIYFTGSLGSGHSTATAFGFLSRNVSFLKTKNPMKSFSFAAKSVIIRLMWNYVVF